MPYGIPDSTWENMPLDARYNAQVAVERARASGGDVEAVKRQNAAYASQGSYTPEVSGQFAGTPISYDTGSPADGGGGYGSGAAPRRELASSPEWLAYLNSLGLEENQFRADIDRQRQLAKSAAEFQIGDLGRQYTKSRSSLEGSLSSRGLAGSGEDLRRQAENRASQGAAEGTVQQGLSGQLGGLESQLAQKLIDLGSRKAAQELQLRTQGYF